MNTSGFSSLASLRHQTPFAAEAAATLGPLAGPHGTVLLAAVLGSTAYGLAHADSDHDRLGVFAAPTERILGLDRVTESVATNTPGDATVHEAAKACHLLLGVNPTLTELLWLPKADYEVMHPLGAELLDLRSAFLSAKRVKDAYLGYAHSQFKRLSVSNSGTFSSDTRRRTEKHARHLLRLCDNGLALYTTGQFTVRLTEPERYFAFGRLPLDAMLIEYQALEARFQGAVSCLADQPDRAVVNDWLLRVRREFLQPA